VGLVKPESEWSVDGAYWGQQITLYQPARSFEWPGAHSRTVSAFTETLLHEIGETVWQGLTTAALNFKKKETVAKHQFINEN